MTTFALPLRGGNNTGNPVNDTLGDAVFAKNVAVNVSARTVPRTMPDETKIHRGLVLVKQAVSSSGIAAGGVDIRVGTTASPDKYGTVRVSAVGTYNLALSAACISAGGNIVFDCTVPGTAADWGTSRDFAAEIQLTYFVKSI